MALLVRTDQMRRYCTRAFLLIAMLSASGCLVLDHLGWLGGGLPFSHEIHVAGEELECVDCHMDYEESDAPGMPPQEDCLMCHEDLGSGQEQVDMEVFFADGELLTSRFGALSDEIIFSHMAHVTDEEG